MVAIGALVVYVPLVERPIAALFGRTAGGFSLVGPFLGFLLSMVLLYSRAAVPFLYFQF
jgi:alginate O-acetyltransferase complex protein AlgI